MSDDSDSEYEFSDWDEEKEREILGACSHCFHCHTLPCTLGCPLEVCLCGVEMHRCKMPDHATICAKTPAPCYNAGYGCEAVLSRERLSTHLSHCPASVVVCGRERNTRIRNKTVKKTIKRIGKGLSPAPEVSIPDRMEDIDLAMIRNDQSMLVASYSESRVSRVRRRDGLNTSHPVVPMRYMPDKKELDENSNPSIPPDADSSDEEKRILNAKMKKKRAMFANCYMCRHDPSSQHLHTLGNENYKYEKSRPPRITERGNDPFYAQRGLMLSLTRDSIPETAPKSENILCIRLGGTIYTRKCLSVVPRRLVAAHCRTHAECDERIDCLVVRCPQWSAGCPFTTERLRPRDGVMRYRADLNSVVNLVDVAPSTSVDDEATTLTDLPLWELLEVCRHLDAGDVRTLTAVNRSLRSLLCSQRHPQSIVEPRWRRVCGLWMHDGFCWSIPTTCAPPLFTYSPATALSSHLRECEYLERVEYGGRVPIVPQPILDEIMNARRVVRRE